MSEDKPEKPQSRQDRELLRFIHRNSGFAGSYREWRKMWVTRMDGERKEMAEQQRVLHGPWTAAEWELWRQNDQQRSSAAKCLYFFFFAHFSSLT